MAGVTVIWRLHWGWRIQFQDRAMHMTVDCRPQFLTKRPLCRVAWVVFTAWNLVTPKTHDMRVRAKRKMQYYPLLSLRSYCLSLPPYYYLLEVSLYDQPTLKGKRIRLHFFFFKIFIYLFMAVLGLRFCVRAFSSCGKRGPLFIAVRGPLTIAASLVAEHRLQTRRLSNCGSRA